jgi:hypothetical protein
MTRIIGRQMKKRKNTINTGPWFSGLRRKLGSAISIALNAFEPSGSPYFYQLSYFDLSVST